MGVPPGKFDYCRLFVDGIGPAGEVESRLRETGRYGSVAGALVADGVWIAVLRNKNARVEGFPEWLVWPVTMEVWRDEETPVADATMLAVVRGLKQDLTQLSARVVVASDFEDEL